MAGVDRPHVSQNIGFVVHDLGLYDLLSGLRNSMVADNKTDSVALSPQENYTDRAIAVADFYRYTSVL
jgi:hypothetical protein